jgi:hypothetical protein
MDKMTGGESPIVNTQRSEYHMMRPERIARILLVLSVISVLALSGCSSKQDPGSGSDDHASIVKHWVEALNGGDTDRFERLHAETVAHSSHTQLDPVIGRQRIWDSIRSSTPGPLETISLFGQDETMCLQVSATETKSSLLYVFEFERELISHIYSYSAEYDVSKAPVSETLEYTADVPGLSEKIDLVNSQIDFINERDLSGFLATFNDDPILFVPPSKDPVVGIDGIRGDVQSFVQLFTDVEFTLFRTIGEGNFVCQQIAVSHGPMNSLGFVHVFEGAKESQAYEYLSRAKIGE